MKSRIFITLLIFCLFGCSDFLEEKSQSEIRPSTLRDMEKLLKGEAYFIPSEGVLLNKGTDIFTDDKCSNGKIIHPEQEQIKESLRYRYSWDFTMFNEGGGGEDLTFWTIPYTRIKGCNVILEYIDQMTGDAKEREYMRGEAYTLRGFYYFMLVNFFGLPYNYGNPSENLAVPLKLTSGVTDEKYSRKTVADCYKQIENDLLKGAGLMKDNQIDRDLGLTRLNYLAAYALLSRMYLYMEDWDNALKYAGLVISEKGGLLDLKTNTQGGVYYTTTPTEILWLGVANLGGDATVKEPYSVSSGLVDVYKQDVDNHVVDIRGDYLNSSISASYLKWGSEWVYNNNNPYYLNWVAVVDKSDGAYSGKDWHQFNGGIRTAEMYLNRAEVYIRSFMKSGSDKDIELALNDLNALRRNRFEAGYVDKKASDFKNGGELLAFYLRERRRELCGEGNHRWFDLRRSGMPEITHIFKDNEEKETEFKLLKEDPRYVLPIPAKVIERNYNLVVEM